MVEFERKVISITPNRNLFSPKVIFLFYDEFQNIPNILTFSLGMPLRKGIGHVRENRFGVTSP